MSLYNYNADKYISKGQKSIRLTTDLRIKVLSGKSFIIFIAPFDQTAEGLLCLKQTLIMEISFQGKRALVTGAGKGIGRGIAIALMRGGAETYALSRTQSDLESLEKEVPGIHTICIDLSDWDLAKTTVQGILKEGAIDLLVNNAGIGSPIMPIGAIEQECATAMVKINLLAAINIAQEVFIGMKASGRGGSIVNMSSVTGLFAVPYIGGCVYAATKGALDAVTRVMAMELGPHNIRVNSINPTMVETELSRAYLAKAEDFVTWLANTPLGKFAQLDDVVYGTLFLLSDKASMITGITLPVDGGINAC